MKELLSEPLNIEGQKVSVGASVGIAVFPEDAADTESLCIAADMQMYGAKRRFQESSQNAASIRWKPAPFNNLEILSGCGLEKMTPLQTEIPDLTSSTQTEGPERIPGLLFALFSRLLNFGRHQVRVRRRDHRGDGGDGGICCRRQRDALRLPAAWPERERPRRG